MLGCRYILAIEAVDHTGHDWLTAFQEVGQDIMGMSADDLKALQDRADANSNPEFDALVSVRTGCTPYLGELLSGRELIDVGFASAETRLGIWAAPCSWCLPSSSAAVLPTACSDDGHAH